MSRSAQGNNFAVLNSVTFWNVMMTFQISRKKLFEKFPLLKSADDKQIAKEALKTFGKLEIM